MTEPEFEQHIVKQSQVVYNKLLTSDQLNADIAETAREINSILQLHNIEECIEGGDLSFNYNTLTDKLTSTPTEDGLEIRMGRRLSDIIFNYYNREVTRTTTYYHYTSFPSFENILRQKELWLYSMMKRFSHGEYKQFYIDHDLDGIASDLKNSKIRQLLGEIFYISFARASELTKNCEDDLWRSFGDDGMGVRLEFEICAKSPDFRNIHYNDPSNKKSELLFNALKDRISKLYGKKLVFAGLAKIGCFYLPGDFNTEFETRLLVKNNTNEYDFDYQIYKDSQGFQFIKLPLESSIADVKLLSVQPGYLADYENIKAVLNRHPMNPQPKILERAEFNFQ